MEKNITIINDSYNALIDAYSTNDAIKAMLNINYSKVEKAINELEGTQLFTSDEVKQLRTHNREMWHSTYAECLEVSKKAYTLKIKGE
jgi:transcription initiation factor IIE alpha subunit